MSDVIYPSAVVENNLPIFCSIIAEMPGDEIPWKILRKCGKVCAYCDKGSIVYYWGVGVCNCVIVLGKGGTHFQLTPSHWSAYLCAFDLEISRAMYSETSSASASSAMGVIFEESCENFHESF